MKDYIRLKVKDIVRETDDALTISFRQPIFGRVRYKSGQFITLIVEIGGKEHRRSYSINSTPGLDDGLSVTVKKIPGGLVSNYLFENLRKQDSLLMTKPMGNFILETDKEQRRDIVLFGAGSGITPLMSIIKAVLYFEPSSTVTLVYSNKNRSSIIFKEVINGLKMKFEDRFFIKHLLSEEGERLNVNNLGDYCNTNPFFKEVQAQYYLCGPDSYMEVLKEGLEKLGVEKERIFYESFTPKRDTELSGAFNVVFKTKKSEQSLEVPAGKSLLDIGLDAGLRMRFACFNGACGTCKCKCLTGSVRMAVDTILSDEEKNDGYVLACVGYPVSDGVVIELE